MQCICVTSSEAATVNENLHSPCSAAKCGWVYRHGFCTDAAHLPNAPWLVRRTGRVFGRSCPALLLFGAFHPRLHRRFFGPGALSPVRRATWKQLLSSTHGPLLCISSCSIVKVRLQEVFPPCGHIITWYYWRFTEKKLRGFLFIIIKNAAGVSSGSVGMLG